MARIQQGIISGTTGSIGEIVVVRLNGQEIIRRKPQKSNKPPTPAQALNQQRMKHAGTFMDSYKNYAKQHFGTWHGPRSPHNYATANILQALNLNKNQNTITPLYSQMMFSKGIRPGISTVTITVITPNTLHLQWQNNPATPQYNTDTLQILFCPDNQYQTTFIENAALRQDQTLTLILPLNCQGKQFHLWAAFRDSTVTQVSDSSYLGEFYG